MEKNRNAKELKKVIKSLWPENATNKQTTTLQTNQRHHKEETKDTN